MNADKPMLDSIQGLYTQGDLNTLRDRLLHSSAWIQHQFTAYGEDQIDQCWLTWLSHAGLSECLDVQAIRANGQCLLVLNLMPGKGSKPVRMGFWLWHNHSHIKRLQCQIDTVQMQASLGKNPAEMRALLPKPDPIIISDCDQQEHPHSPAISPSDLVDLAPELVPAVKAWWSLWCDMQFANIQEFYAEDALIEVPGLHDSCSHEQLFDYACHWFALLKRRHCQLESVIVDSEDPNRIGLLWHLQGDRQLEGQVLRVSVPIITYLVIEKGKITRETTLVDGVTVDP